MYTHPSPFFRISLALYGAIIDKYLSLQQHFSFSLGKFITPESDPRKSIFQAMTHG